MLINCHFWHMLSLHPTHCFTIHFRHNTRKNRFKNLSEFQRDKMASVEEGQVIGCHSVEEWNAIFQKAVDSKKLVVVDFTASWCGPCRFIAPILAEIAKKTPEAIFLKVDVDELKTVSEEYSVEAMPSFVFLKEGKEIDRVVGARKEELQSKITLHAAVQTASA